MFGQQLAVKWLVRWYRFRNGDVASQPDVRRKAVPSKRNLVAMTWLCVAPACHVEYLGARPPRWALSKGTVVHLLDATLNGHYLEPRSLGLSLKTSAKLHRHQQPQAAHQDPRRSQAASPSSEQRAALSAAKRPPQRHGWLQDVVFEPPYQPRQCHDEEN